MQIVSSKWIWVKLWFWLNIFKLNIEYRPVYIEHRYVELCSISKFPKILIKVPWHALYLELPPLHYWTCPTVPFLVTMLLHCRTITFVVIECKHTKNRFRSSWESNTSLTRIAPQSQLVAVSRRADARMMGLLLLQQTLVSWLYTQERMALN